ncbi:XK-related protein 6 [Lingula anatina]|uniref:XK-related protein n=1 Tax=Lingula anatina TaxID=7574 RepID=A0A1S3H968_LINAN|nr:XK-related protein 6 [Lingula anatina]|eukprot:XP_013382547.1 XK-related protein 6 [Lingula anatina]
MGNSHKKIAWSRRSKQQQRKSFYDVVDGPGFDTVDHPPEHLSYTCLDALFTISSVVGYIADTGFDIALAVEYWYHRDFLLFGWTAALIVLPSIILTVCSIRFYILDAKHSEAPPEHCLRWLLRAVFLLLHLAPVIRYIESIYFGYKSRKCHDRKEREKYYYLMLFEDVDSSMLRLFECFTEAAPQLVLQLYIMINQGTDEHWLRVTLQIGAVFTSWISLSWSIVAYHKALRYSRNDKKNMEIPGIILMFLWRSCIIAPRVIVLALFIAAFGIYSIIFPLVHWIIMTTYLISSATKAEFCKHLPEEYLFKALMGIVYIFCFINIYEGHTRFRYLFVYTLEYVENAVLILLWYFMTAQTGVWYHLPAPIFVLLLYPMALVFMTVYYLRLHPTGAIHRGCLPCPNQECCAKVTHIRENYTKESNGSVLERTGSTNSHHHMEHREQLHHTVREEDIDTSTAELKPQQTPEQDDIGPEENQSFQHDKCIYTTSL